MRRAVTPEQSEANARRAADRLREATDLLKGIRQQEADGRLDSLTREADRLASEQHEQADRLRQLMDGKGAAKSTSQPPSQGGLQERAKLAHDRQRMASNLSSLKNKMQHAARGLSSAQRPAASRLRDALNEMDRSGLQSRLQSSADSIRGGMDATSNSMEPAITAGIERLREQMHQAQQALSRPEDPEETLARAERLRNQMESLVRNLGDRSTRSGQSGQQLQRGQQAQAGQQGQVATANDGFQSGPPGGPRTPGGPNIGTYIEPPGAERASSVSPAQIERAFQEALRELNELREDVRGKPESLSDIQEVLRELHRLDPRRYPGNPALVEQLRTQVLTSVDKLELQLRRELDDKRSGQIRSADSLPVPAGYQDSVAEYFRRLSQGR
jgi:hypothetical protein